VVDRHPVGALGPDGAHPPLGIAVRTWGPRRSLNDLHALAGEDLVERAGEPGVTVADEEADAKPSWTGCACITTPSGCTAARGLGYVTPDDEHHGRGQAIRAARRAGFDAARTAWVAARRTLREDN